ncbi:hypothetical protein Acr_11g0012660 [Actinidia rufa]|uniref:Phytocyanin domain-containing protein n=1 Tax=Actinidia rufa TaxID=165716 RepID=A0A7J0FE30_9ERIC|nr:hypothetical protein Acr_11g0012660 [Actinidia rufa]
MARLMSMLLVAVVAAVILQCATAQTVHVVGDNIGWTIPSNGAEGYITWASSKTFLSSTSQPMHTTCCKYPKHPSTLARTTTKSETQSPPVPPTSPSPPPATTTTSAPSAPTAKQARNSPSPSPPLPVPPPPPTTPSTPTTPATPSPTSSTAPEACPPEAPTPKADGPTATTTPSTPLLLRPHHPRPPAPPQKPALPRLPPQKLMGPHHPPPHGRGQMYCHRLRILLRPRCSPVSLSPCWVLPWGFFFR